MGKPGNAPSQLRTKPARISRNAFALLRQRAEQNNSSVADELDKVLGMEQPKQLEFVVTPSVMRVVEAPRLTRPPIGREVRPGIVRQITPGTVRRE